MNDQKAKLEIRNNHSTQSQLLVLGQEGKRERKWIKDSIFLWESLLTQYILLNPHPKKKKKKTILINEMKSIWVKSSISKDLLINKNHNVINKSFLTLGNPNLF